MQGKKLTYFSRYRYPVVVSVMISFRMIDFKPFFTKLVSNPFELMTLMIKHIFRHWIAVFGLIVNRTLIKHIEELKKKFIAGEGKSLRISEISQ